MRVKVISLPEDWHQVRIKLPLNWLSANAAGNVFGGYQASLADPIAAIGCLHLFPGYRIATKKLELEFLRVGNSDLILHFDFSEDMRKLIRHELDTQQRSTPCFDMSYVREDGKVCTHIRNTVAIRPKGYVSHLERGGMHAED
ncbi:MAG TPA: hypothetical protein VKA31_02820 [Mariprofundaceae bacterium]|nr:hypothetical protein [Mariprofundaceae bacterium]